MAQWLKVLDAKVDKLSLISRSQTVEGENRHSLSCPLNSVGVLWHMFYCPQCVHKINVKTVLIYKDKYLCTVTHCLTVGIPVNVSSVTCVGDYHRHHKHLLNFRPVFSLFWWLFGALNLASRRSSKWFLFSLKVDLLFFEASLFPVTK